MRIIPAIDIIEGKCVRLSQGNYEQKKVYNEKPLEVAKAFEDAGVQYLHLVDLDGAKASHVVNWKILETIANKTSLQIDFGGGIKSNKDIEIVFESGAKQATVGSIAVNKPELFLKWLNKYGGNKIILGADAKNEKIATNGWLETSNKNVIDFITNYQQKGVAYVICTDISKDGMLAGPSFKLYDKILQRAPNLSLIASGGISSIEDLVQLRDMNVEAAIIGKAIYENKISMKQLQSIC